MDDINVVLRNRTDIQPFFCWSVIFLNSGLVHRCILNLRPQNNSIFLFHHLLYFKPKKPLTILIKSIKRCGCFAIYSANCGRVRPYVLEPPPSLYSSLKTTKCIGPQAPGARVGISARRLTNTFTCICRRCSITMHNITISLINYTIFSISYFSSNPYDLHTDYRQIINMSKESDVGNDLNMQRHFLSVLNVKNKISLF